MWSTNFSSPPPATDEVLVAFPVAHVLLVTLNRPAQLNSLPTHLHAVLDAVFQWYDGEPSLRCAVIAGRGRAFCAGADLKEYHAANEAAAAAAAAAAPNTNAAASLPAWAAAGFGGLSNRAGKKPVVAAVHGVCVGGGMEMALNCDLVVAAAGARFGLPEVTRGVVAVAGALPRVVRILGRQRAAELVLTGRLFSADEMAQWGVVNRVVRGTGTGTGTGTDGGDSDGGAQAVVDAAVALAATIAANSPDAVIVSREGMRLGGEGIGPAVATDVLMRGLYGRMNGEANMREGVRSFVERRPPVWTDSKL